jgi:transposase-like protein
MVNIVTYFLNIGKSNKRVSIRGLRRTYGVSTQTVLNWIKKNG